MTKKKKVQVFIMHIGHPGNVDVPHTITRRRNVRELLDKLHGGSPERRYFETDAEFHAAFPDGKFHCWGVPTRAVQRFHETEPGDLVLFAPTIGVHNGGIHQLGVVLAKCAVECYEASKILWPITPYQRPFPYVFFFNTEAGYRPWFDFLDDIGYSPNWNPRGFYRRIGSSSFLKWGGPMGYLTFLRQTCNFRPI